MPEIDIERHKERACTSKRYFSDKASAKVEVKIMAKKGVKLRIYSCQFCDGFHHTSRSLADIEGIQQTFHEAWAAAAQRGVK
jgi:hypothetical protein